MPVNLRYSVNDPQVISETIDGEAIIVNLETGTYYSIQSVGGEIWQAIEQGATRDEIANDLSVRYNGEEQEIVAAVHKFVNQLVDERLIRPRANDEEPELDLPGPSAGDGLLAFELPVLQKYTDMADLLLLDPIHEVDEAGWPKLPNPTLD